MILKKIFFTLFLLVSFSTYLLPTHTTFAQSAPVNASSSQAVEGAASLGVANMVVVQNKNVPEGSILTEGKNGAVLSTVPYDPQVLGIVSRDAGIILSSTDSQTSVPVISNGTVYILVSSQQGAIKKGDILTTSTIPGVAVKATNSGYVLGNALEDYTNADPKKIGKIAVSLSLHYFNSRPSLSGSLTDILKLAILPTNSSPAPIFKGIVAAAVVLGSFILGFMTFGRTAAKGVEALGRNPSASAVIHLGIILNVLIVIAIVLAGLVVSFFILRL